MGDEGYCCDLVNFQQASRDAIGLWLYTLPRFLLFLCSDALYAVEIDHCVRAQSVLLSVIVFLGTFCGFTCYLPCALSIADEPVQLSCEVLPTQARLPKVRFLLAGVGIRDVSTRQQQRMRQPADTVSVSGQPQGSGSISSGRRMGSELEKVRAMAGVPKGSEGTGSGGLYGLLQASLDQAIWESLPSPSRHEERPEGVPGAPSGRVQHGFSSGGGGHERKEKKEKKVGKGESSGRGDPQRSEIGAGRALFGGFVPLRHAPAASLFDSDSGVGAGEGSPQGGGYGGGYESIYRTGDGRSSGSRYAAAAGGTLASLDDAKIRQYAQEATARAQRLNAEKRNARVARSKRQG